MVMDYFIALFITLTIETPIYFELGRKKNIWYFLFVVLLNLVSNLTFNYLYSVFDYSLIYLIIGEILVFIIESAIFWIINRDFRSILLSLIANVASLLTGLLVNYIIFEFGYYMTILVAFEASFFLYFVLRLCFLISNRNKTRVIKV